MGKVVCVCVWGEIRLLKMSKEDSGVLCFCAEPEKGDELLWRSRTEGLWHTMVMNLHGPDWWVRHREDMLVIGQS